MTEPITGRDLIDAGLPQGKWFKEALAAANGAVQQGESRERAMEIAARFRPAPATPLKAPGTTPFFENIEAATPAELDLSLIHI